MDCRKKKKKKNHVGKIFPIRLQIMTKQYVTRRKSGKWKSGAILSNVLQEQEFKHSDSKSQSRVLVMWTIENL